MSQKTAVQATVTGQDEGVGFRAAVMKQAIAYNLAGSAVNEPNNIVTVTLQGDGKRIDKAIDTLRTDKKFPGITIATQPAKVVSYLETFTIVDWTSSSRHIATPYTLVFDLREEDDEVSAADAKGEWHEILEDNLDADDLKKLDADD
jgi:acylphosphatase